MVTLWQTNVATKNPHVQGIGKSMKTKWAIYTIAMFKITGE